VKANPWVKNPARVEFRLGLGASLNYIFSADNETLTVFFYVNLANTKIKIYV
jgi:hypothetical protein